jgi:hypothetical protein
MAQYEHLPIYKAAFDLQIYFEGIVKNFSRYHKYTHGAAPARDYSIFKASRFGDPGSVVRGRGNKPAGRKRSGGPSRAP